MNKDPAVATRKILEDIKGIKSAIAFMLLWAMPMGFAISLVNDAYHVPPKVWAAMVIFATVLGGWLWSIIIRVSR